MNVTIGETVILTGLAELQLLEEAFQLPYEMVVPDVMLADELLDLHGYDLLASIETGARLGRLDGHGVDLVIRYQASYPALSTTETFALVLAEAVDVDSVLVTDESMLRSTAEAHGVEVRGLPWILDEIERHGTTCSLELGAGLWRGG